MRPTRNASVAITSSMLAIGVFLVGVRAWMRHQVALARRRIGKPLGEIALDANRVWRKSYDGEPIDLLMLGDSIAAGLGAERPRETLGARIAKGVARGTRRPVRLRSVAVVGAESSMLSAQLDSLPGDYRPDVAVVIVGGNDITHRVPTAVSVTSLQDALTRVRDLGASAVVGTCPDLGMLRPVPQPLRSIGSRLSRRLAQAQTAAAVTAGADVVSLRRTVGPLFRAQSDEMFSPDRFHPSALGYKRTAHAFIPAVVEALTGGAR